MIRSIWRMYLWLTSLFARSYNRFVFFAYKVNFTRFPITRGRITLRSLGAFSIGDDCTLNSEPGSIPSGRGGCIIIQVEKDATFIIGNRVGITSSTFFCANSIIIQDDVFIGEGCKIADTDFHSLRLHDRLLERVGIRQNINTSPVIIGNGCFIGAGAIILKGVEIGDRSIVGAGAVVTRKIPPMQVWAGNPARFIRNLRAEEL